MYKSSNETLPRDFWSALARLGATGAPGIAWEFHAGTEYPLLAPFLKPDGAALSRAVPCPQCGAPRRVSRLPDDTFIIEQGDHCRCPELSDVYRDRVAPVRINTARLIEAAASVLHIAPARGSTPGILTPLGTLTRGVDLVTASLVLCDLPQSERLQLALTRLPPPSALLLATPTPEMVGYLRSRGYSVFPAASLLMPKPKGAFLPSKRLVQILAEHEAGIPVRPHREPLAMRGKRYAIEEGYVAVNKLGKKPVTYPVTQPRARALLRALVESGAGSEDTALNKQRLLALTYPDKKPPDVRPSQLLRYTSMRGLTPMPFRDDILRQSKTGGLYWLAL